MTKNISSIASIPDAGPNTSGTNAPAPAPTAAAAGSNGTAGVKGTAPKKPTTKPAPKSADTSWADCVSFGKLFLKLVASQVDKDECDELQIFFYGLNDECGCASGFSVAEFMIELSVFKDAYKEKVKTLGTSNIPIEMMLSIVMDSHFSDPAAKSYGMSTFYDEKIIDKKKTKVIRKGSTNEKDIKTFIDTYGDLRLPQIEMFTETVTSMSKENVSTLIKRIHIYDKLNSPYGFEQQVLDSTDSYVIGSINAAAVRNSSQRAVDSYKTLAHASETQLQAELARVRSPEQVNENDTIKLLTASAGVQTVNKSIRGAIKNYLMTKLPTLVPGTIGSLIISVSAASKSDGLQGAIYMKRALDANGSGTSPESPSNGLTTPNNMPIKSVPMQVTMSTLGVPIAALYQKFFIDFNTGTTIDNIYNCNQIQHSFTQGKFTTNWTFIYDNGYAKFTSPPNAATLLQSGVAAVVQGQIDKAEAATAGKKKADAADAAEDDARLTKSRGG